MSKHILGEKNVIPLEILKHLDKFQCQKHILRPCLFFTKKCGFGVDPPQCGKNPHFLFFFLKASLKTDIQFNYCIQNFLANILVNNSGICPKQNIFDTGIISELPNILRQEIEEMNTKMLHSCHNLLQNNCSGDLNHHFLSKSTAKIVDV